MKNYNNIIYPFCDLRILNLPEIQRTIQKQKGKGLLMALLLFSLLKKCKNAVGMFEQLGSIAAQVGVKTHTLKDMLKENEAFRCDEEHGIFWSPRQRRWLKMSEDPSEEEKNEIAENGNVYIGIKKKNARKVRDSQNKSKSSSSHLQDGELQSADNQPEASSLSKSISISIKSRDIEIENNKTEEKQVSLCNDAAADEIKLKEILNSKSWCRSVTKRRGVNLEDKHTLSLFAKWMYDYCVSEEKELKNKSDVRKYANNLLRENSKTRDEWERFYKKQLTDSQKEMEKSIEIKTSCYERVFKNTRYSYSGYQLPVDAPLQTSDEMEYSYTLEKWIAKKDFNRNTELKELEHKKLTNPGYVMRTGGSIC